MEHKYSRQDIENFILGLRGKPYSHRQMLKFYAAVRDNVGQQLFSSEQVKRILINVIAGQLFPQQNKLKIANKLDDQELSSYISYLKQLLGNIENIKRIRIPDTEFRDLDFLRDALIGCGLKRYTKTTLQAKVRNYLREANGGVTQKYDYSQLSGATINGVLESEYSKLHKLPWGLSSFSQELVKRSQYLREAIALLESNNSSKTEDLIIPNNLAEQECLDRAIRRIKRDLPRYSDETKMKLVCLKFIKRYGKPGRRKLSTVVHPDVCKDKNASLFQSVLNDCSYFDNGNGIQEEIVRLTKKISQDKKPYKRKFHHSAKWQEYVERRRANGWHSQYYGDAV